MEVTLPGFTYKQFVDTDGETKEHVYETTFVIELDCIECIMPSTGPEELPDNLPFSRVVGKSGRFYDINLCFRELQLRINRAKHEQRKQMLLATYS